MKVATMDVQSHFSWQRGVNSYAAKFDYFLKDDPYAGLYFKYVVFFTT